MKTRSRSLRMGLSFLTLILLLAGNLLTLGLTASASEPQPRPQLDPGLDFVPGQILVAFEPADRLARQHETLQARGLAVARDIAPLGLSVVRVPAGQELALAAELSQLPGVLYAEPDYLLYAVGSPDDPSFAQQWGPAKINAPAAWDVTTGSVTTTIAIIDTGIDLTHPDLQAKIVAGYDFVNGDATAQDDNGHGTHTAGIAAAIGNNGVGVAGVSWRARLMPVKVLGASGSGTTSGVAQGITWAVDHGATVISMSLGGASSSTTLNTAVNYAYTHGVVVVAAAGNDSSLDVPTYPAALSHVIGVGATTSSDVRASYSNRGAYVDVAAPGSYIYATFWSASAGHTYAYLSGTSMATPHVAGLAALLKAVDPTLTPTEVEAIMGATAVDLGAAGRDGEYGMGRIDALAAVNAAGGAAPTPPAAPLDLSATAASSSQIDLSWQDNSADEQGFRIERKTGAGAWSTLVSLGAGVTAYANSGLAAGTAYCYRVLAYSAGSDSDYADEACATTEAAVPTPDLVIDSLTLSPAPALPGQQVALTTVVMNAGTGPSSPTRLDLYVERTPAGCGDLGDQSLALPALAAGASQSFTFSVAGFAAVGSHALSVWADPSCAVAEGDETNNSQTALAVVALYQQRVDVGSTTSYRDLAGSTWAKDRVYRVGGYGFLGGSTRSAGAAAIAGTQDDPLYRTERFWTASANPAYRFSVPNGTYRVELRFAETLWNAANKRKFSVKMEGKAFAALTKFDIFAAAGAKNKAVVKAVNVTVADGVLDISFIKIAGYDTPKVDAIYVRQTTMAGAQAELVEEGDTVEP